MRVQSSKKDNMTRVKKTNTTQVEKVNETFHYTFRRFDANVSADTYVMFGKYKEGEIFLYLSFEFASASSLRQRGSRTSL